MRVALTHGAFAERSLSAWGRGQIWRKRGVLPSQHPGSPDGRFSKPVRPPAIRVASMVERAGFEPAELLRPHVFQTCTRSQPGRSFRANLGGDGATCTRAPRRSGSDAFRAWWHAHCLRLHGGGWEIRTPEAGFPTYPGSSWADLANVPNPPYRPPVTLWVPRLMKPMSCF